MADKEINPFKEQDIAYADEPANSNTRFGSDIFSNVKQLQVGNGSKIFRANESGIWLGGSTWSSAPFRVDMLGNMTANSVTLTGYIQTGGASADVNAGTTLIQGGKIVTGSVTALQIASHTITANEIAANTITASQLNFTPVDSTNVVASINASVEGIKITGARIAISGLTTFTSGYDPSTKIPTGNAASDVNTYSTKIDGGHITAHSITSTEIATNTLTVGTNVLIGSALGAGQAANDINSYSTLIQGGKITTNSITANQIQTNAVTTDKLTAGILYIGGTNQPTAVVIAASSITGNSRLGFENGSRMWEDSSARLGLNALGSNIIFYINSTENVNMRSGDQTLFRYGLRSEGAFNCGIPNGTTQVARFTSNVYFDPTTATAQNIIGGGNNMNYNATTYHYFNIGGNSRARVSDAGVVVYGTGGGYGALYLPNSDRIDFAGNGYLTVAAGTHKTAIVSTSQGYNALYCMESPEVWFMDFTKDKNNLDPLFSEVTVSPYHYIKCEDGEYQVWGKRKGHERYRFESKTKEEFKANEKFLQMNRPQISKKSITKV